MNNHKVEKSLKRPLKKILSYKPISASKKPEKQPSKAELEQVYKYENGRIVC